MAQRALKQIFQRRLYASAAVKPEAQSNLAQIQVGQASNGIRVVTDSSSSPVARVVCCVKAGSRYEQPDERGVAHCLRICSDNTQKEARAFTFTRDLQQMGGTISCTTTRENIIYTLTVSQANLSNALPYLTGMVAAPSLRPWEISDSLAKLELEQLCLTEQADQRVVEAVHEAAYRDRGLGRSLYAPRFQMFNKEKLQNFINRNFTPDRITLSGVGVEHDDLLSLCSKLDIHTPASATDAAAKYFGGEIRENSEDMVSYSTIVGEGSSVTGKDIWAFSILEQLLGPGNQIKWASNLASSKLNQAAAKSTQQPFIAQAFNVSYSDSGLFGVNVISLPENSSEVLKAVTQELKKAASSTASAAELAGAKARVKSSVAFMSECAGDVAEMRAVELQARDSVSDLKQMLQAIDSVQAQDVQAAAKKVIQGKLSMASVGELSSTPYLDELMA